MAGATQAVSIAQARRQLAALTARASADPDVVAAIADLQSLLAGTADQVDVTDYGADNTGVADSAAAFRAAAIAAAGGRLVIPAGTYLLNSAVPISSKTSVAGLGQPWLKQGVDDIALLTLNDATDIEIVGIKFDGNGKGVTLSTYVNCAVASADTVDGTAKNCRVHDCTFVGFKSWCVTFAGHGGGAGGYSTGVDIDRNVIRNQVDEGINLYYIRQFRVVGNRITNHANEAIKATTADEGVIESNRIYCNGVGAAQGPLINVGTNCSKVQILENYTFQGNKGIGVEKVTTDIVIEGNIITGTLQEGIGVSGTVGDAAPMKRISIVGNQTKDTGQWGIAVQGITGQQAADVVITGNVVTNCGTSVAAPAILCLKCDDAVITGNTINTSAKEGIHCSTVTVAIVSNNRVYKTQQHGIRIQSVVDLTCQGNIIVDPSQGSTGTYNGIDIDNSNTNAMVAFNVAKCVALTLGNGVNCQATGENHFGPNRVAGNGGNAVQLAAGRTSGFGAVKQLGVGNAVAAAAVATVQKAIQVFDEAGNSLGYVPVYLGFS